MGRGEEGSERTGVKSHRKFRGTQDSSLLAAEARSLPGGFGVGRQTCENWVFPPRQPLCESLPTPGSPSQPASPAALLWDRLPNILFAPGSL